MSLYLTLLPENDLFSTKWVTSASHFEVLWSPTAVLILRLLAPCNFCCPLFWWKLTDTSNSALTWKGDQAGCLIINGDFEGCHIDSPQGLQLWSNRQCGNVFLLVRITLLSHSPFFCMKVSTLLCSYDRMLNDWKSIFFISFDLLSFVCVCVLNLMQKTCCQISLGRRTTKLWRNVCSQDKLHYDMVC